MNATNHMATGALIAITIKEPALVLPLAFLSHFALDAIPHFGYGKGGFEGFFKHRLTYFAIFLDLVGVLILLSAVNISSLIILSAIVAISPDFVWYVRYFFFERKGIFKSGERMDPLSKIHAGLQWLERPWGLIIETSLSVFLILLLVKI